MSTPDLPKYRCQKKKYGVLAFVEFNGKRRYLGLFNTPESLELYDRVIAEWLETGRSKIIGPIAPSNPNEITIVELCAAFWEHVEKYYRRVEGTPTSEQENFRQVMKPLKELYGRSKVSDFGPRALKAVRQKLFERRMNRITINKHTSRLKSIFKWGVEQEIVPAAVWHGRQSGSEVARRMAWPTPRDRKCGCHADRKKK